MAKKTETQSVNNQEITKKLSFEIRGLNSILYKTPLKKIDTDIDPRTILSTEEAIIALNELEQSIYWCQKWQENIKIWDSFISDMKKELNNQEFIIKDVKKSKDYSQFDTYYRVTVSLFDFTSQDELADLPQKFNDEISLVGIFGVDLSLDGEILTFLSENKDEVTKAGIWFYNTKVLPVINNIKKL